MVHQILISVGAPPQTTRWELPTLPDPSAGV